MAGGTLDDSEGITGINVVPLVDITLVLLIIMMVTAKIIVSQAVPLDLPKAATGQKVQRVFAVQLRKTGEILVDSQAAPNDEAVLGLARQAQKKEEDLRVVIEADKDVTHGRVITVIDLLKQAGVKKIAFGSQPAAPAEGATEVEKK